MTDASLTQQIRKARSKFVAMAATYSLGVFNDNFFKQAAMLMAIDYAREELQGYAAVVFALPYLLCAAYAGWCADRFSKHHVVIGAKFLELAAMICGAIGVCLVSWPLILTMVCLMGLQSCLFGPSLNGSIPELYPASYVTKANAYLRVVVTGAILAGYAFAGLALDNEAIVMGSVTLGHARVAVIVLIVAVLGVVGSFGVPRRPAAAPKARFPWEGPVRTLKDLATIRRDKLLAIAIGANAFVWFAGAFELPVINLLGETQFDVGKKVTSALVVSQLIGVAIGGLISSVLAKGERWYRFLPITGLGMAVSMVAMGFVPLLPGGHCWAAGALLLLIGIGGGMFMIPCEAYIQVRPQAEAKGKTISASNFTIFTGILISGPVYNLLNVNLKLKPTTSFMCLGFAAVVVSGLLFVLLPKAKGT